MALRRPDTVLTWGKERLVMSDTEDVRMLSRYLQQSELCPQKTTDHPWRRKPAARVIDCVLSLNRRYDSFVVPRLQTFGGNYPGVCSVTDLKDLISQFPSPYEFVAKSLDYCDVNRARILSQVVDWLASVAGPGPCEKQLRRLERWAEKAHPLDYEKLHIRGFALAGFSILEDALWSEYGKAGYPYLPLR